MSNCDDMTHFIAVTGGVGEWIKPPVLKTGDPTGSASSNLAPSATLSTKLISYTQKQGKGTRLSTLLLFSQYTGILMLI